MTCQGCADRDAAIAASESFYAIRLTKRTFGELVEDESVAPPEPPVTT